MLEAGRRRLLSQALDPRRIGFDQGTQLPAAPPTRADFRDTLLSGSSPE
jgi:hypothetical protein